MHKGRLGGGYQSNLSCGDIEHRCWTKPPDNNSRLSMETGASDAMVHEKTSPATTAII